MKRPAMLAVLELWAGSELDAQVSDDGVFSTAHSLDSATKDKTRWVCYSALSMQDFDEHDNVEDAMSRASPTQPGRRWGHAALPLGSTAHPLSHFIPDVLAYSVHMETT